MSGSRADLREAASSGLLLLCERGVRGGVELREGLLVYDPELPVAQRAPLVRDAIRRHGGRP